MIWLGAMVTSLAAARITVEQLGRNTIWFGNAAGASRNYSYYLSFIDFTNSSMQFVFSSMNVCIHIAFHLHTVYWNWLQLAL
jgi:hypothetical protein